MNESLKNLHNSKPKQQNKKQKRSEKPVNEELKAFKQMSVRYDDSGDDTASTH